MGEQLNLDIKKTSSEMFTILKSFCSEDSFRHDIIDPFTIGEYTYASNGKFVVRIPKIPEAKIQKNKEVIESILKMDWTPPKDWLDFPKYTLPEIPEKVECDKCDSNGEINCPSCDGEGNLEFDHDFKDENGERQYHTYQVDCDHCDGYGKIECGCENQPFKKTPIRVPIDERDIDAWVLDRFKVFTNVKIALVENKTRFVMLGFEEGFALLMPLI